MLALPKNWKYVLLAGISFFSISLPSLAGEKINIIYSPFQFSLQVDSLEKFPNEGIVNQELKFYLKAAGLKDEQKEAFRPTLLTKYPIDGVQQYLRQMRSQNLV